MRKIYSAITILFLSASAFAGMKTNFSSVAIMAQVSPTAIETFSIEGQTEDAVIDTAAATVVVKMATGTDVTALVPTFTLSEGADAYIGQVTPTTLQVSGESSVDFSSPVVYTIENDGATQDWTVTVELVEAITESTLAQVSVYPNPVINVLTISNMEGVKAVVVSNVLGQELLVKSVNSPELTINTADFKNGIYIVTLVSENGLTRSERIVKK